MNTDKARTLIGLLLDAEYTNEEIVDRFRVDGLAPTLRDQRKVGELVDDAQRGDAAASDAPAAGADVSGPARRGRGRPGWTRKVFQERLAAAEAATPEPRTDAAIAEHFRGTAADGSVGITPETLARLRQQAASGVMPE